MSRQDLFPPIAPYETGRLERDAPHSLYWELCGNPEGQFRRLNADQPDLAAVGEYQGIAVDDFDHPHAFHWDQVEGLRPGGGRGPEQNQNRKMKISRSHGI